MTADAEFLKPVSGNGDPVTTFMTRKLKAAGDVSLASGLTRCFDIPKTPWPVIQEAARIGLYGFESLAGMYGDPGGISAAGTPDQLAKWVPRCYGDQDDQDDPRMAAFRVPEPRAGPDVSAMTTGARYDEARDQWVSAARRPGSAEPPARGGAGTAGRGREVRPPGGRR